MAGAELDVGAFAGRVDLSKRWLDTEIYEALLKPIVTMSSTAICTPSDDATQVGKRIWARVREFKDTHAPHSEAFSRTSMQGFAAAYGDWRNRHPRRKIPTISFLAPLEAADVGWELVQRSARNVRSMEFLFWGLGILGWVATIYSDMRICRYCFRWSVPGSPFCFLHSQSRYASDRAGKAYVRYRAGAKVLALAQTRGVEIRHDDSISTRGNHRQILAEHLFFQSSQEGFANELRECLQFLPRVLKSVGGKRVISLPDDQLLKRVRERMNPMEWVPQALLSNALLEENILLLEEERTPGRPEGKRTESLTRMTERAKSMFGNGSRITDVATALKQNLSTVSNWTHRFEDVRCAYKNGHKAG